MERNNKILRLYFILWAVDILNKCFYDIFEPVSLQWRVYLIGQSVTFIGYISFIAYVIYHPPDIHAFSYRRLKAWSLMWIGMAVGDLWDEITKDYGIHLLEYVIFLATILFTWYSLRKLKR